MPCVRVDNGRAACGVCIFARGVSEAGVYVLRVCRRMDLYRAASKRRKARQLFGGGARRVGRSRAGNASSGCSLKPFASFQRGLGNVCTQNLSAFRFALMRIVCAYKNCGFCRGSAKSGAGSAFSLRFGKGGAGSIKTAALLRARESRRSNRLPRACCKRPWRPGMSR